MARLHCPRSPAPADAPATLAFAVVQAGAKRVTGNASCTTLAAMTTHRHLMALALAPLLSACATSGPAHRPAPATAGATAPGAAPASTPAGPPRPPPRDPHLPAAPPQAPALPSPVVVPLDGAALAALPRQTVVASGHGRTLRCEGVALAALPQAAGAMPAEPLRGAQLGRYVLVEARDGDRVLFALSEFDPTLGHGTAALVDRCDGKALGDDGPLRVVVPGDARRARWVRQVEAITVIVAP